MSSGTNVVKSSSESGVTAIANDVKEPNDNLDVKEPTLLGTKATVGLYLTEPPDELPLPTAKNLGTFHNNLTAKCVSEPGTFASMEAESVVETSEG